ncbi:MAG TPA: SPOR domain-containing protein [Phenylobacterium sp.]|nr:SPOR domain-containing protein [Phenylobacterium sp.]
MIISQHRAPLVLVAILALGVGSSAAAQGPSASYPPSRSLPDVAAWLQKETPILPAQVVDISPSAITAVATIMPGGPRSFLATVDSEAVNPDIEAHDGVSSWSIPVEVNCEQRSVRLGAMTGFRSRDLRSGPKVLRPADTEFVTPTATAPLGAVIRALCDRDFKRPLVGVSAKIAGKPGAAVAAAKPEPTGPKPEIVAAAPRPKPEAKKAESAKAEVAKAEPAKTEPAKPEAAKAELMASAAKPDLAPIKPKTEPAPAPTATAPPPKPAPAAPTPEPVRVAAVTPPAAQPPKPAPAAPAPERVRVATVTPPAAQPPKAAPRRPIIPSIAIQVGASPDLPEAKGILARVKHRYAGELDGFKGDVATAEVGGKPLYRALISGFSSTSDAKALCAKLQAGGQACFVRD